MPFSVRLATLVRSVLRRSATEILKKEERLCSTVFLGILRRPK